MLNLYKILFNLIIIVEAFIVGFLGILPKALINSFYYNPSFFGKVILSPIFEEVFKTSFLYIILYINFKYRNNEYNIILINTWMLYSLGLFTGLGFGVSESIFAYNLLNKPNLLFARSCATILHMCNTFISGIGLTKYLLTNQRRYILTIIPVIIFHSYWNYCMNFIP